MVIYSFNSSKIPLLLSAFSNVLPRVICGQPIGRECDTQPGSNCRGAQLMGIRATWPAQRRIRYILYIHHLTYPNPAQIHALAAAGDTLESLA